MQSSFPMGKIYWVSKDVIYWIYNFCQKRHLIENLLAERSECILHICHCAALSVGRWPIDVFCELATCQACWKKGRWSISSDSTASEDTFSQSSASIHTYNHVTPPVSGSLELVTDMRFYSLGTRSSLTDEAWLYCLLEICRSSNKILPFSEDHCLVTTKWSVSCGARKRNKTHTLNDESHFQFVWDREGETWREETEDTEEKDRDSLYYWIWRMSHLLQASACLFFRMELVFGIIT